MGARLNDESVNSAKVPTSMTGGSLQVAWLDAIIVAACELPPTASLEEVTGAMVDAMAEVVPVAAIGICVAAGPSGQIVVMRSSRGTVERSPDPTRLFPEFSCERVVPIRFDETSTLHVATDDDEGLLSHGVLERLALVVGSVLRNARSHEQSKQREAEMRGLQAQVIQSEKLASLGQIAAGIVHELNNPLTSIVAYADYLRKKGERQGADPADVERLLRINEAAERILRFSRDLIAYSRPSTEVPAAVPLHDVIDRALVFCEHVVGATGVRVERRFGAIPSVRGVPGQLTQVFVNLVTNACHAMQSSGGTITITTTLGDGTDTVVVEVRDEGCGIHEDHLTKVFEPFFTTKADGLGTGLGLSIVRNIVVAHGGEIRVAPHTSGGTVFSIELPVAAG